MVLTMGVGLCTAVIFTHAFDRAGDNASAGVFALLILFAEFLTLLNNFGLISTLPKLVASCPIQGQRDTVTWSILTYQLLTSVLLVLPIFAFWIFVDNPSRFSVNVAWIDTFPYIWGILPLVLLGNLRENILATLAGLDRYGHRALGLIVSAAVNLALVFVFVGVLNGNLSALLWATIISNLVSVLWLSIGIPSFRLNLVRWREYRSAVRFSLPLYANSLLGFAFLRGDTLFVAWMLGPLYAAYYELVGKRFAMYLSRILVAALTPFLPTMSVLVGRGELTAASEIFSAVSIVFTAGGYVAILAIVGAQVWLVGMLFPPEYSASVSVLGLVLTAAILNVQGGIAGLSLVALEKPKIITLVNVFAAAASFAGNLLLIPWLGIVGAGIVAVTVSALSNFVQTWYASHCGLSLSWKRYFAVHALFAACVAISMSLESGIITLMLPCFFVIMCVFARVVRIDDYRRLADRMEVKTIKSSGVRQIDDAPSS